jgi:hypothetical protein
MRSSDEPRDRPDEEQPVTETDQEVRRRRRPLEDYEADLGRRSGSLMWSLARGQGG